MASPQKAKGSAFERLIAAYLAEAIPCERIPPGSVLDRGDLWTPLAAIQCKNQRTLSLGSWLDATTQQQENAAKPYGFLVVKRKGVVDPARQFAVCSVAQLRTVLVALQA